MKKVLFLICAVAFSSLTMAQMQTPQPSPFQEIEQKVGLTDVTLQYSRPSMKGRKIFGGLVPYNELWRTGANANTKITFSDPVTIGKTKVDAGTYAIFTKPGMDKWEIFFYSDADNWGTPPEWDQSKVAAKVMAEPFMMDFDVQTFTMSFDDLTNDSVNLGIMWEKVYVSIPIKFETDKMVTTSIEQTMAGPSANDYFSAAVYYLEAGKDMNKAKMWIDKAIEMREQPAFWYHRQQSLIYAKSGDKAGAIKAAKRSLELAEQAENSDYVALNKKSLKEWGAM